MAESKHGKIPDLEQKLKQFLDSELGERKYLALVSVIEKYDTDSAKQTITLESTQTRISNLEQNSPYFVVAHLKKATQVSLQAFFSETE